MKSFKSLYHVLEPSLSLSKIYSFIEWCCNNKYHNICSTHMVTHHVSLRQLLNIYCWSAKHLDNIYYHANSTSYCHHTTSDLNSLSKTIHALKNPRSLIYHLQHEIWCNTGWVCLFLMKILYFKLKIATAFPFVLHFIFLYVKMNLISPLETVLMGLLFKQY